MKPTTAQLKAYNTALQGEVLAEDARGKPIYSRSLVMFTTDCKGRSDIVFGRVVSKSRGNIMVAGVDANVHDCLNKLINGEISEYSFRTLNRLSLTVVSHNFFVGFIEGHIFEI